MEDYQEFSSLRTADFPAGFFDVFEAAPTFDEYLLDALPDPSFSLSTFAIQSTRPTRTVDEGDVIDLGDRHFEVLHLPGHSPGSLGLYDSGSGTLFSGDAIYDGELLDDLPDSSISDYVVTMRRLRELPVQIVHGGHEPSFGRERLIQLIDGYLDRRA